MLVFVIKQIRLKKNLTLYELSKKTDLSRTYLRLLENNKKTNPSVALDVNIKDLFYSELDIDYLKKVMYSKIDEFRNKFSRGSCGKPNYRSIN